MYKVPVCIRDEYVILFEPMKNGVLIHCDVHKWSPSIYKMLVDDFNTLRYLQDYRAIYALHSAEMDDKHVKFLQLMGFNLIAVSPDETQVWQIDGVRYDK